MKKLQFGKDALILSIMTLITVLIWIGFDVYRALTKTEIPQILQKQIAPLNPQIDRETIEKIKTKETISEEELERIPTPAIIPSPEATPASEATPGGETRLEAEQTTESGEISQ